MTNIIFLNFLKFYLINQDKVILNWNFFSEFVKKYVISLLPEKQSFIACKKNTRVNLTKNFHKKYRKMRKIQFIILLLTFTGNGQNVSKENFMLENSQVYWQKVFPRENLRTDSLKTLFEVAVLPKIKHTKLDRKPVQLSFDVEDGAIDYKRYGGRNFSTRVFAKQAHLYHVVVEFKDERYRVTISQIQSISDKVISVNEPIEEAITKKGETFLQSKLVENGLHIMNLYFTEKFTIPQYVKQKTDW